MYQSCEKGHITAGHVYFCPAVFLWEMVNFEGCYLQVEFAKCVDLTLFFLA
jgi:hypothetical protein